MDPCENFFEAACGKHSGFYDSRVSKKTIKVAQFLDGNKLQIMFSVSLFFSDFFKSPQPSFLPSKSGKVMKQFYDLCEKWKVMNETEQREEQSKAISDMIKKWGPIPMFDKNWKESDFDLNGQSFRVWYLIKGGQQAYSSISDYDNSDKGAFVEEFFSAAV